MPRHQDVGEQLLRAIFAPETLMCIRGCTFTDEDGVQWGKDAKWGHLCGSCFWRIRYRLGEAPKIIVALRTTMVPLKAQSLDGKVDGTRDRSLPFLESSAPEADEFFGVLVDWAVSHAEALSGRPASTLPSTAWRAYERVLDTGDSSRGLPAGLSPDAAAMRTQEVVQWLIRWGAKIAELPAVVAYHDDIVHQVARYRSRAGLVQPRGRAKARRACDICMTSTVEVSSPDVGPLIVRCTNCHQVFDPSEALAGLEVAA